MVGSSRIKYKNNVTTGSFMGVIVPQYKHFELTLLEHVKVGTKDGVEVSKDYSFDLTIKSNINNSYKEHLDNILKDVFKMNWAPYTYASKSYRYYTNNYLSNAEQLVRINNIFDSLTKFEQYYNEEIKSSIEVFKKDSLDKRSYCDYEVAVKYNIEKDCFVLLALRYLGKEKFFFFKNRSFNSGMLGQSEYKNTGFFDNLVDWSKIKRDVTYFEISSEGYLEIRNLVEVKEKAKKNFLREQTVVLETIGQGKLANFDEENIFGLKIKYDEQEKMFEFYCKGYDEPKLYGGAIPERTLLSSIAVNYFLSRELMQDEITSNFQMNSSGEYNSNDFVGDRDLSLKQNQYKYNLEFDVASSKKLKSLYLPLKYNDVLKEIISNYEKNRDFFGRKVREIKVKNENPIDLAHYGYKNYPSIYLNDDGRCFFVLSTRETKEVIGNKILNNTSDNQNGNIQSNQLEKSSINLQSTIIESNPTDGLNNIINTNNNISSVFSKDSLTNNTVNPIKKVRQIKSRSGSFSMKALELSHEEAFYYLNEHPWCEKIKYNSVYLNSEIWMSNRSKPQINHTDREHSFNVLLLNNKIQGDLAKNKEKKVTKTKANKI